MEYFPHLLLIELNLPAKVAPRMHYNREVFFFLTIPMPNKVNHKPFRFLQNFSLSFDEGLISFLELKNSIERRWTNGTLMLFHLAHIGALNTTFFAQCSVRLDQEFIREG